MTLLMVALGAAVGAPSRYLIDRAVQARHSSRLPWGTWTVNVIGSLVLGFVVVAVARGALPGWWGTAVGTGFCGALTTYSTFGYEVVHLLRKGASRLAAAYAAASIGVGLFAAWVGGALATLWWR